MTSLTTDAEEIRSLRSTEPTIEEIETRGPVAVVSETTYAMDATPVEMAEIREILAEMAEMVAAQVAGIETTGVTAIAAASRLRRPAILAGKKILDNVKTIG